MNIDASPISLSIAAPAYNEADGIESIIRGWHDFLKQHLSIKSFEIVICNDGSQDKTPEILNHLANEFSEIRIIHFKKNQGAATALAAAIKATQLEWVLLMDTDNQFPIHNLNHLLTALQNAKTYIIHGIRHKKDRWSHVLGSKISGTICNIIHRSKIKDFNSAYKLIHGPLIRSLHLEAKGMNYSTEITSRLIEKNLSMSQVYIEHIPRTSGKSHARLFRDGFHRFLFIIYLALRQILFRLNILRKISYEDQ